MNLAMCNGPSLPSSIQQRMHSLRRTQTSAYTGRRQKRLFAPSTFDISEGWELYTGVVTSDIPQPRHRIPRASSHPATLLPPRSSLPS